MAIYTIERESGKTEKESETGETHIVFTFPHLTHKCWNICCDSIRFSVHSVPFPLCISFSCRPALSLSLSRHLGDFSVRIFHFRRTTDLKSTIALFLILFRPDFHFFFAPFLSPVFFSLSRALFPHAI